MRIFLATLMLSFLLAFSISFAQTLPALPQVYIDTTMPVQTGQTFTVTNCVNLQSTINSAQLGDTIIIDYSLTCTGHFSLPEKTTGTGWIIIQSSALANLPPEGVRIDPAVHAQYMPKILGSATNTEAMFAAVRAHHYRLIGIEFGMAPGVTEGGGILALGPAFTSAAGQVSNTADFPHHLIVDRSYVHGQSTLAYRRGIRIEANTVAIVDSYISDIHDTQSGDTQAIAGWNFQGPLKVVNNYLESAGENFITGGAPVNVAGGLTPSDIEIRRNYFFKPLSWKVGDPSYAGIHWLVKNSFELKNAQRVLFEGNVLQNNWADAQNGAMIQWTPRRDTNLAAPVVQDITFRYNRMTGAGGGISVMGRDSDAIYVGINLPDEGNRIWVHDNVIDDISTTKWGGSAGYMFLILYGVKDLRITHNTGFQTGATALVGEELLNYQGPCPTCPLYTEDNFVFQDNIFSRGTGGYSSSRGEGTATLNWFSPSSYTFLKNVIVGANSAIYPANNFYPAGPLPSNINFVNYNNGIGGDYHLLASSPYKNASTDGKDVGADIDMVNQMTAGAVSGIWSGNYTLPPPPADTTPPSLSGGSPSGSLSASTTQATLQVTTNENANCKYSTTAGVAYASMTNTFTTTGSYSHSATISGLTNGGSYNYYVRCQDTSPNLNQNTIDYIITFSVAQITNFGRPASDVTTGWTGTTVPHWDKLDEVTASDTDSIRTGNAAGTQVDEVKLSNMLVPSVRTGHILRVRAGRDGTCVNTLNYALVQGTTIISSANHSLAACPNYANDTLTLTTAQASQITDYSDLRVRLTGNAINGRVFVSWIEFEVPAGGSSPTCGSTPASTCVSGSPPSYCNSAGSVVNNCQSCGCPGSQQCNSTTSTCYTQGFSGLILNGRITRTTSGTPCASCTIDITLAGQTGSATTTAAGDFSIVLTNPVAPGQYIADIGINDGVMQQSFKRRVTI